MAQRLTLILGGAHSGKSDFAQALARKRGGDAVVFVATAEARDKEMRARIAAHRAHRPAAWGTIEAPREVARALQNARGEPQVVVIDCLTLLVANILLADASGAEGRLTDELDAVIAWQRSHATEMIVVSNEVGWGIVPDHALGRVYRDLLGAVNRKLAETADEVFLLVAGLPVEIKLRATRLEEL
jgi:adenosyl cobinamide kinase/adenosyl cobinamide phosphate guanylyltransferase